MKFLDFKEQFKNFNVITFQDIKNVFGKVNKAQLSLWKSKGYLKSVRKGMYVLVNSKIDNFLMANELNDSYISLEFALSYYQIIPEISRSIISVSKDRQEEVNNEFGTFYYHKISPKLYSRVYLDSSFNITESRYKLSIDVKFQNSSAIGLDFFNNYTSLIFPTDITGTMDTLLPIGDYYYNNVGLSYGSDSRKKFFWKNN